MDTERVSLRDYIDSRFTGMEAKVDGLAVLMRRELDLLSEDRERQRHDLSERLEGMNALRSQLDKQAATFAPLRR
jgi:RNA binding exosome subunit